MTNHPPQATATELLPEISDAMIEAGIDARDEIHTAMRDRNLSDEPEDMPDYDDGHVMRAIYTAMHAARPNQEATSTVGDGELEQARDALQAMMDAWFDYHDAHSLTQPVTGAAGNAFDRALAARDRIEAALTAKPDPEAVESSNG